ncbi:hypothetical protein [Campylobacter ureolyticus]|uniref:hypothetical protein n=1 Tax=Campylobacter ureolyticus TaxID=827 RepID=UPI0022B58A6A|nr:hypothetical protein [Campylobacter ureolyticus]MCZ6168579.1 hypothetical protein [Campylobacter ureolyticus]
MYKFEIQSNRYLKNSMIGYYDRDMESLYVGGETPMHTLKNMKLNTSVQELLDAKNEMKSAIKKFLVRFAFSGDDDKIYVCIVPRSKASFNEKQLYFKKAVQESVKEFNLPNHILDGTDFIIRVKDTKTTHIKRELAGFDNIGSEPYPGIAKDTCRFHFPIKGKQILLIDDIYTIGCNVDEDFIQTLYDFGASRVFFYAVGRTVKSANTPSKKIGE